jgi:hypothetical protein
VAERAEVTAGGTEVVPATGLVLLRALADKTILTGGLSATLASDRLRSITGLGAGGSGMRDRGAAPN